LSVSFSELSSESSIFFLIAGPCVIENEDVPIQIAMNVKKLCKDFSIPFIFKASFRKANRTSSSSFTGIGDEKALKILNKIRKELGVSVATDIHESHHSEMVASYVDMLQIPAFLCRQTDLINSAARTGKMVNIKKGQFMSAQSMEYAVDKVKNMGNEKVMLTERGNSFGYNDLVVDMRNIPLMQKSGAPVLLDCTHANQKPNQPSGTTSGRSEYIETLAKAGIAAGANGLFIETHPDPSLALSDGSNMLALDKMKPLLAKLVKLKEALV